MSFPSPRTKELIDPGSYGTSTKLPFGICAKKVIPQDAWGFPPHHCCYQPQGWMRSIKVMRWIYIYTFILYIYVYIYTVYIYIVYIYICMYVYIVYFVYASCTHVSFFLYVSGCLLAMYRCGVVSTVFLPLFRLTGNLE